MKDNFAQIKSDVEAIIKSFPAPEGKVCAEVRISSPEELYNFYLKLRGRWNACNLYHQESILPTSMSLRLSDHYYNDLCGNHDYAVLLSLSWDTDGSIRYVSVALEDGKHSNEVLYIAEFKTYAKTYSSSSEEIFNLLEAVPA